MIRAMKPRWPVSAMTIDEVGAKLKCDRCDKGA
jgi:hypothetical protein